MSKFAGTANRRNRYGPGRSNGNGRRGGGTNNHRVSREIIEEIATGKRICQAFAHAANQQLAKGNATWNIKLEEIEGSDKVIVKAVQSPQDEIEILLAKPDPTADEIALILNADQAPIGSPLLFLSDAARSEENKKGMFVETDGEKRQFIMTDLGTIGANKPAYLAQIRYDKIKRDLHNTVTYLLQQSNKNATIKTYCSPSKLRKLEDDYMKLKDESPVHTETDDGFMLFTAILNDLNSTEFKEQVLQTINNAIKLFKPMAFKPQVGNSFLEKPSKIVAYGEMLVGKAHKLGANVTLQTMLETILERFRDALDDTNSKFGIYKKNWRDEIDAILHDSKTNHNNVIQVEDMKARLDKCWALNEAERIRKIKRKEDREVAMSNGPERAMVANSSNNGHEKGEIGGSPCYEGQHCYGCGSEVRIHFSRKGDVCPPARQKEWNKQGGQDGFRARQFGENKGRFIRSKSAASQKPVTPRSISKCFKCTGPFDACRNGCIEPCVACFYEKGATDVDAVMTHNRFGVLVSVCEEPSHTGWSTREAWEKAFISGRIDDTEIMGKWYQGGEIPDEIIRLAQETRSGSNRFGDRVSSRWDS